MSLTGAQALARTLAAAGIRVCFTNPGTSEIHLLSALDRTPEIRAVLTLFEGVATGAADGYARMASRPAATVLHLGPGLGNGLANLHNARRAMVPLVNIVGDHATTHVRHDAPLQSDIETAARNVSAWIRTSRAAIELPGDGAEAVAAATVPPGAIATLIVPADVAWEVGAEPAALRPPATAPTAGEEPVRAAAAALRRAGARAGILLGGDALRERALLAASRAATVTGARLLCEMFPARAQRGAGLPAVERLAYWPELASRQLGELDEVVLAGARAPVTFFGYPDTPASLLPPGCVQHQLAPPGTDALASLEALADELDAGATGAVLQQSDLPEAPSGELTAAAACRAIARCLPEGAIVSDEAITSGLMLPATTAGAPRHDWLTLTGGAIGQGLPVAVGAAIACPDRPVLALEADGSAMYTFQALWTMVREQLNVTIVLFSNRSYGILRVELARLGVRQGPVSRAQLSLAEPEIDFVSLAAGLGVPARRVRTAETLTRELRRALSEEGPHLIEAVVPAPEHPPAAAPERPPAPAPERPPAPPG